MAWNKKIREGCGAYGLDDARDYFLGWDVAVVLEEIPDGTLDRGDGRVVPAYAAVFGTDGEVDLVWHCGNDNFFF